MKKLIFGIGFITILSKLAGFLREISLSYFFGASKVTDVFLISQTIPNVIFGFVSAGIFSAFVPIYNEIKAQKGVNRANYFANNLLGVLFLLASLVCIFIAFFTQDIVKIFAMGFEGETMKMAVEFTRITMFGIYVMVAVSVFSGILQINNKFYFLAAIGFPFNFILVIGIYIAYKINPIYLPIANVCAIFSQLIFLIYPLSKTNFKLNFKLNFKDEYLKKIFLLIVPIIINSGASSINTIIDKTLASSIIVGGITVLSYAVLIQNLVGGLSVNIILTVFFPKISDLMSNNKEQELKLNIKNTLSLIIILTIPLTCGIIYYSYELVDFILNRGNFTEENALMTADALKFYAALFFSATIRIVFENIYYAMKRTKTILINSIIGISLNVVLNIILSRYMGLNGLALATSISSIITMGLLAISLKKYNYFDMKESLWLIIKVSFATFIMFGFLYYIRDFITTNYSLINILLGAFIGLIVYAIILMQMKIEQAEEIKKIILKSMKYRKANS